MKKLSISGFLLAAALLTGCNDKDTIQEGNNSGTPVLATFKISSPKSYANAPAEDGTEEENQITTLEFYMFDSNGVRDEKADVNYSYHKYEGDGKGEVSFMVRSGNNKKILVAVNGNVGELTNQNYDAVEQTIAAVSMDNTNSQSIAAGNFAMSGKAICNIEQDRQNNEVTIAVSRLAAKIEAPRVNANIQIDIPDGDLREIFTDQTVTSDDLTFALDAYVVVNGYNKSYVYTYYNTADDETSPWTNWAAGGKHMRTTFNGNEIASVYSGAYNGSVWLAPADVEKIFVYENQPRDTTSTVTGMEGYVRNEVYAFLIQGRLINDNDNQEVTRYWRINLIKDDNYKIFRNTIYRVTLDRIMTTGYGNPKEGEEDKDGGGEIVPKNDLTAIEVTVEIVPWRVKTQGVEF